MFVATRRIEWTPLTSVLHATDTIEQMESWIESFMEEKSDGDQMYVYQVDITPVMKYTVVHEIRGDAWDGPSE